MEIQQKTSTENHAQESNDEKCTIPLKNLSMASECKVDEKLAPMNSQFDAVVSILEKTSNHSIETNAEVECESGFSSSQSKVTQNNYQYGGSQTNCSIIEQKTEIEVEKTKEIDLELPKNTDSCFENSGVKPDQNKEEILSGKAKKRHNNNIRRLQKRKKRRSAIVIQNIWREYIRRRQLTLNSRIFGDKPEIHKEIENASKDPHQENKIAVSLTTKLTKGEEISKSKESPLQNNLGMESRTMIRDEDRESKTLPLQNNVRMESKTMITDGNNESKELSLQNHANTDNKIKIRDESNETKTLSLQNNLDMGNKNNIRDGNTESEEVPLSKQLNDENVILDKSKNLFSEDLNRKARPLHHEEVTIPNESNTPPNVTINSQSAAPITTIKQNKIGKKMGILSREHTRLQKQKSAKSRST